MRIVLLVLLSTLSFLSHASNQLQIVEIANFYCPVCNEINRQESEISTVITKVQGNYHFVPIYWDGISKWPALTYLGAERDLSRIRRELFNAASIGMKMDSLMSVCSLLTKQISSLDLKTCQKNTASNKSQKRFANVVELLKHAKIQGEILLPLFILEKHNKIIRVLVRKKGQSADSFISEVKYEISNNS